MSYNNQGDKFMLYIVKGKGPNLLGRNWLEHLILDWKALAALVNYCKRGKICWAKHLRFSRFSGVPRKFFREYKCLFLIILNNEYLCTDYSQGNAKIFLRKL